MLIGVAVALIGGAVFSGDSEQGQPHVERRPPPYPERLKEEDTDSPEDVPPGTPTRLGLHLSSSCPARVEVGVPFEVEVVATNVGTLALAAVTLGVRGGDGLDGTNRESLDSEHPRVKPGASVSRRIQLVAEEEGPLLWYASAREERGWAAAGLRVHVTAQNSDEFRASDDVARTELTSLDIGGTLLDDVSAGEPFRVLLRIENTGDRALSGVRFAWSGGGGVELAEGESDRTGFVTFEPARVEEFVVRFQAPPELGAKARLSASARDGSGWAAGGITLGLRGGVTLER